MSSTLLAREVDKAAGVVGGKLLCRSQMKLGDLSRDMRSSRGAVGSYCCLQPTEDTARTVAEEEFLRDGFVGYRYDRQFEATYRTYGTITGETATVCGDLRLPRVLILIIIYVSYIHIDFIPSC
jgi:hypothetical protein